MWRLVALALLVSLSVATQTSAALFTKMDRQKEIELGREAARYVEQTTPLCSDKALQARVQRIGRALTERLEPKTYPYDFKVLAVSEISAFCLPGGFIYINEGLLNRLQDDDEVAFVMAHELTHAAHRHYAHRLEEMDSVQILGGLLSVLAKDRNLAIAQLVTDLTWLRYSRVDEDDADSTAMELIWNAGFDLQGGVRVMQVFAEMEKGRNTPKFLRDHPPAKQRFDRLKIKAERLAAQPRPAGASASPAASVDPRTFVGDLPSVAMADNPYFPLAPGNEWSYQVEGRGGVAAYTVRVISVVALEGGAVYRVETVLGKGVSVYAQLLTGAGEVWRRTRPTAPDSAWQLDCLTSLRSAEPVAHDGWQYMLLGREPIALPCGTFPEAVRIRRQGGAPTVTEELWFVAGVGMVKRSCADTGVTETLVAYKLAPPARSDSAAPNPSGPAGPGVAPATTPTG